jgi:hypothetical protein
MHASSGVRAAARAVASWALGAGLVLSTAPGSASVETRSGYTKLQTYNAALRYLRVDLAYEVTEKDADAAYLLFNFVPDGRKKETHGAIEIVERKDDVLVYVRVPDLPHYQEEMLSDGLFRKLRTEYGDPPRREDPGPEKPRERDKKKGEGAPDGGTPQ